LVLFYHVFDRIPRIPLDNIDFYANISPAIVLKTEKYFMWSKKIQGAVLAGILAMGMGASQANAQDLGSRAYVHSVGGWDLIEVKDATDSVLGFWGIPRVQVEVGNIRRLWFEALPNNDWDVWAFEPVAISAKVQTLIQAGATSASLQFLMSQESMNADTAINLDVDGGVEGLVIKGFISGDPLADAAGALADPDPMIDLLADVGYPIAPGMTDLMVDGTAGANVGMNPATKVTLDCLRSLDSSCGDCICTQTELPPTYSAWTIYEFLEQGRLRCEYSRTESHLYWREGFFADNCEDCTAGSADSPLPYIVIQQTTDYWYDLTSCPETPLFDF
jgi:hypothetical protein